MAESKRHDQHGGQAAGTRGTGLVAAVSLLGMSLGVGMAGSADAASDQLKNNTSVQQKASTQYKAPAAQYKAPSTQLKTSAQQKAPSSQFKTSAQH